MPAFMPPAEPPAGVASPCVRRCTLNDEDVCVGCGRTLSDIVGWTKMSDLEKAETVARAKARLADLAKPL